ncbi:ABC transporter ATP-binding protein [Natrinema thermotolerans]|uniref:ABC transporter ATP-binding protein n=1 Tax=Natrinema thermotolerans TaxID=121872 RepID=A0AAF0PJ10_9EURY|nr:ABC transporter ATP-binding protein [Natrinema thermotolerans]QCC58374.1 ABC transporter ATP-binding protein [Natrinema thermotolerans]WMT09493.1 ABC transporter ATP-binding protein [Natrinema thermotolerans]
MDVTEPVATADGVSKSFGDDGVLEAVDLIVEAGELLVLMGPNGVGKSVLLSCLAGSQRPSAGDVEVFGEPATARADTTSFLLQDALALEKLTGRENVNFYRRLHPQFTDAWRDHVARLGIADDLDRPVADYSGGMVRKLELAIAASIDVPLYLFDEPTAALDLATVPTVHELFREKRAAGKTLVVTSHRPMNADVADRLAFLAGGRIVATGAPEELLASVPPVLETRAANASALAAVADGEPFAVAGNVRAVVPSEYGAAADPEGVLADLAAETGIDRADLSIVEPTYTALFNYYTNGVPTTNGQ